MLPKTNHCSHASKKLINAPMIPKNNHCSHAAQKNHCSHAAHCFFFMLMACLIEIVFQWACLFAYVPVSWNTLGISICCTYSIHSDACIWDTPRSHSSWSSRSPTGTHPPTRPPGWCHPPWGIWWLPSGSHSGSEMRADKLIKWNLNMNSNGNWWDSWGFRTYILWNPMGFDGIHEGLWH